VEIGTWFLPNLDRLELTGKKEGRRWHAGLGRQRLKGRRGGAHARLPAGPVWAGMGAERQVRLRPGEDRPLGQNSREVTSPLLFLSKLIFQSISKKKMNSTTIKTEHSTKK